MLERYRTTIEKIAIDAAYDLMVSEYQYKKTRGNSSWPSKTSMCDYKVKSYPWRELDLEPAFSLGDIYHIIFDLIRDVNQIVDNPEIQSEAVKRFIQYIVEDKEKDKMVWEKNDKQWEIILKELRRERL